MGGMGEMMGGRRCWVLGGGGKGGWGGRLDDGVMMGL